MPDTYGPKDAAFDDEQLNGPRCPRHGRGCDCCHECGRDVEHGEAHLSYCADRPVEDDPVDPEPERSVSDFERSYGPHATACEECEERPATDGALCSRCAAIECSACNAEAETVDAAIESGWAPEYVRRDGAETGPVCPGCIARLALVCDEDGIARHATPAERFASAVTAADEAFWAAIVAAYPEARDGDLSPEATRALDFAQRTAVAEWIDTNVPRAPLNVESSEPAMPILKPWESR